jgi:hypothetical protein
VTLADAANRLEDNSRPLPYNNEAEQRGLVRYSSTTRYTIVSPGFSAAMISAMRCTAEFLRLSGNSSSMAETQTPFS